MKLEGMLFDSMAALLAEIEEILRDISITEWAKVFDEWKNSLKRYIDAEGEYLENDQFDLDVLFISKINFVGRQGLTPRRAISPLPFLLVETPAYDSNHIGYDPEHRQDDAYLESDFTISLSDVHLTELTFCTSLTIMRKGRAPVFPQHERFLHFHSISRDAKDYCIE
jgi:hypothetical protein